MGADDEAILVAVADLHVNRTVALCPPAVNLDSGGTYRASKPQRALFAAWKDFWHTEVFGQAVAGIPIYIVIVGDLNDLNVHSGVELISGNRADIIKMSGIALDPILSQMDRERGDRLFINRGTRAHTGDEASLEEEVAKDVGAEPDEVAGTWSWWWLPLLLGDVRFDISHHPDTSSYRPYTRNAAAERQSAILLHRYAKRGDLVPHVGIRAHVHYFADSGEKTIPRVFYCPPWCFTTPYGRRRGTGGTIEPPGGLIFHCRGGRYTFRFIDYPFRRRKPWRAK